MVVLAATLLRAVSAEASRRDYRPHPGYLAEVETADARDTEYKDLVIMNPPPGDGPSLRERIFNEKLSREFTERYYQKFGRTEIERVYQSPNRFTYYNDLFGFRGTVVEMNNERRKFGEFMLRRLSEYHVDHYLNHEPSMRPVYELKERLSNIRVEVEKTRIDLNYSYAGNILDVKLTGPYLPDIKVSFMMDPGAIGPGPVGETEVSMRERLTQTVGLEQNWRVVDGIFAMTATKALSVSLSSSLTAKTFTKDGGASTRESVYLAGLGYVF